MTNEEILKQLLIQRDEIYQQLSSTTLSGLFNREYESILSGETFVITDDQSGIIGELKKLKEDKTHDSDFAAKLNLINRWSESQIANNFINNWNTAFDKLSIDELTSEIQAVLIIYDAYDLPTQNTLGLYGKNEYPKLTIPKYLLSSFYDHKLYDMQDVFDFTPAWPDCEEFDWTTEHLEGYFELQRLFKLNSRVIMHKSLSIMDKNGSLSLIKLRPFYFYIAEHDLEAAMLYRLS